MVTDATATTANAGNTFSITNATGSTEASDLGLVGSTTGSTITGGQSYVGDIDYTLQDGQSGTIDLSQLGSNATLGDVIQQIKTQSHGGLASLHFRSGSTNGLGLVITDTTSGGGTFSISNAAGSTTASDLGLVVSPKSGTVTGSQILGGLNTVLLADLNGGQGLGTLGYMKLTDGSGNYVNVDLTGSVTLQDVSTRSTPSRLPRTWTSRPRSTPPATGSSLSIRRGRAHGGQ